MKAALGFSLAAALALAGCSAVQPRSESAPPQAAAPAPAPAPAPKEEKLRPFPGDSLYDLLVAEFALRRGDYQMALNNYMQQAFATRDVGVTARATHLAEFLHADRAALDAAQLWVSQEPDNLEAQFTLATQLAKAQRPLEALPHMVKVMEGGSKPNFAVIAAAALAMPEQTQEELLNDFNQLLIQHKDNIDLMTGKALLQQQRGKKQEALALIRKVLDASPNETYAIIIEAKLLEEMGRLPEAYARLDEKVKQNPYNRRLRLQYARLLTHTDMTKAREQFAILVQQSPDDGDLLLSLALVTKETGALDDAEQYFRQLLELGQHEQEAHFYLGQLAEQRGDHAGAIAQYQQVAPSPDFYPALGRIIALQLQDHHLAEVRKHLRDLRGRYPQNAVRLYLVESEVLMHEKEYKAGTQLLTAALKKFPGQPNLLYARSMFSERRQDMALLEKDLRAILAKDPDNVTALNALGYSLANLTKRYDEAYALIKKALAQKPDDPAIIDSMGWVEYRRGNLDTAQQLLEKAYTAFPDPEVAAHFGEVLWHQGNRDKAREIWLKALKEEPDNDYVRAVIKRLDPSALPAAQP